LNSIVILQARTNSSRLPAKVLLPIKGVPVVVLAAKRASNTGKKVIVVTSKEASDDALAETVLLNDIQCFRGSLENTLERVVQALSSYNNSTIVFRLTADNIFPDGRLLDEIEQDFVTRKLDYLCCNGESSGLPYGMSVEVTLLKHLREADEVTCSDHDREHVTPYIIRKFGARYFEKYRYIGKGHFRCTIDFYDDYLNAQIVFSKFNDPVSVPFLGLVSGLNEANYQPIGAKPTPLMVVGGAQLGLNYGIANKVGQPEVESSEILLKTAIANGVNYIDTARAYGESEEVIGISLNQGWSERVSIITKLSPLHECPSSAGKEAVAAFVDASIYKSCSALKRKTLDVLMLHRMSHINDWNGAVWQRLKELKSMGVINSFGVSVQCPSELMQASEVSEISFVQMPYNILDWRWDKAIDKTVSVKEERPLCVHIRSALLQGLLTSQKLTHWQKANVSNPELVQNWLSQQVVALNRKSIVDLCLAYVRSKTWVDGVVVGMEELSQLVENIDYFNAPKFTIDDIAHIEATRPKLSKQSLNPALWSTL